jgi:DNA polymerase IV
MILHVDMDAFYASVEQRDHPQLRGQPVVVGGSATGRGVVAAASYEARQFGIHSAMPSAKAARLCPHAHFVKPRIAHYASVSRQIREVFERYTPLVEPLSLDEAFLDVTGSIPLFPSAEAIAREIRHAISTELSLNASIGVATNKFIAKIASDLRKPNALVVVPPGTEADFLAPLPISRLWGIGPVSAEKLTTRGINTIAELRKLDEHLLTTLLGSVGGRVYQLARGLDERPVVANREAKSISKETTFETDVADREMLEAWLVHLAEEVGVRLRSHHLKGRTIHLKLRYSNFETITRSVTRAHPTDVTRDLISAGTSLLAQVNLHRPVRLLGLGISEFRPVEVQLLLFEDPNYLPGEKPSRADEVADAIRQKFGQDSLRRAKGLSRYPIDRDHERHE